MIFQIGDLLHARGGGGYIVRGCRWGSGLFGHTPTKGGNRLIIILQPTNPSIKKYPLEFSLNELMRQVEEGSFVHYPIKKKTPLERMRQKLNAKSS
jgi:hypothetical protein